RDSWRIIVEHWEKGDPAHGLTTPLKDWHKDWLRGPNRLFAAKHGQRRVIATEYIITYKRDEKAFLDAYPEAEE
ncbi:hypothetical protein C8F04DRAFT_1046721, partial [Mycena alexandri]